MKVLLLVEASSAGVGRHVMDLARGLLAAGQQVHLFYAPERIDARFTAELEAQPALTRTCVSMRRGPHWSDLAARRALRACLVQHGPFDVVHAHSTKGGFFASLLPRRNTPPFVYTPHSPLSMNAGLGRMARRAVLAVERHMYRRMRAVIAVSVEEFEHLLALGVPKDRLHMVPNGIAPPTLPSSQQVRSELGVPDDCPVVGFVGRLANQKDPLLLLQAFALVRKQLPTARLLMVGDGPLRHEVEQTAAGLGDDSAVTVLGYRDAQQLMPAFDLLALSSRYEGLPYVLLEALAAGLPIVAMPVGGIRQTVTNDINGMVCRERTATCLAEGLLTALAPATRERMGTASRKLAAEFTDTAMAKSTLDVYQSLMGAATAASGSM